MDKDFFVMLYTQQGGIVPMLSGDGDGFDELALYDTEEEAREWAQRNILGATFGFEIFERGTGEVG